MQLNEKKVGYVEYEISIFDGDNDLVEIYKAYSEKEKDDLIEAHFHHDSWNQDCFVSKKETVQHIYKRPTEPFDDF